MFPLLLERSGAEIAQRRMSAPPVVEELDSNSSVRAAVRVVQAASWTSSTFSVAKKLSATALSQQFPRATHAADDPLLREDPLVVAAGVLAPPIRMMQQARRRAPAG